MPDQRPNRVRELREAKVLAQVTLAERARLSRQSLGAIEAGRATPAVDVALRIARALDCDVEALFGDASAEPLLETDLPSSTAPARVALAHIRDRWVSLPLTGDGIRSAADGLVRSSRGKRAWIDPMRPLAEPRENLVLTGCATGLALLSDRLNSRPGPGRFLALPGSSLAALDALTTGFTHVAGVHLTDDGADANVTHVQKLRLSEPLALVTLARWEAGLLTRQDDARISSVADLARPRVRLVAREKGAGAQRLLERQLRAAGVSVEVARSAPLVASGHLEVARAIAMNAADAGVATRDAALAFGLRFIPLAEERYDLVLARALLADPRVERLLDVLVSQAMRRELTALGYDTAQTGRRVADVEAR